MSFVLTLKEFEEKQKEILNKLDSFIKSYDEFTKKVNSKYWRRTGAHYSELKQMISDIKEFEPLKMSELEKDEWVRDALFTDKEKELWDETKKFNL